MSTAIRRALYGKMTGDTTLSNLLGTAAPGYSKAIYNDLAPEQTGFPYVVFFKSAGTRIYTMKGRTSTSDKAGRVGNDVWTIKAIDHDTSADGAEAVQARLENLLTDATLTISGETLLLLKHEDDVEYSEEEEGEIFLHRGGLYRLMYE